MVEVLSWRAYGLFSTLIQPFLYDSLIIHSKLRKKLIFKLIFKPQINPRKNDTLICQKSNDNSLRNTTVYLLLWRVDYNWEEWWKEELPQQMISSNLHVFALWGNYLELYKEHENSCLYFNAYFDLFSV